MKTLYLIILFFILSSCAKEEEPSAGSSDVPSNSPNYSKLIPSCYTPYSASTIITTGDFSATLGLTTSTWNDPSVIKVGSEYWMYASSDDNFDGNIKIYRLISSDGVNWTPNPTTAVLEKSAGKFDSKSAETPSIVYFSGQYHLFWTGYTDHTDVGTFRVGHATSPDGIVFTKDTTALVAPTDPYGAANLDFDQFLVGEPGAAVFNNKIYLYFTAIGANIGVNTTLQVIGLVTSSDGVNWSSPISALGPDQTQYPRVSYRGFSTPNPIVMNEKMHLYHDVYDTSAQVNLGHAVSSDGITSWTQDSSALHTRTDFTWTATEIRSPAAYLEGSTLMLWYAGHSTGVTMGIGYSTCSL